MRPEKKRQLQWYLPDLVDEGGARASETHQVGEKRLCGEQQEVGNDEVDSCPYRTRCRLCVASSGWCDGDRSRAGETGNDTISIVAVVHCLFSDTLDRGMHQLAVKAPRKTPISLVSGT